jgi:hypothetical protein
VNIQAITPELAAEMLSAGAVLIEIRDADGLVGAGLMFAGLTGRCGMARVLQLMPIAALCKP